MSAHVSIRYGPSVQARRPYRFSAPAMADAFGITASGSDAWRSLDDTTAFLELLARLKRGVPASDEERAAAELFSWDSELVVARAPGRLDVMGAPHQASSSVLLDVAPRPLRAALSRAAA